MSKPKVGSALLKNKVFLIVEETEIRLLSLMFRLNGFKKSTTSKAVVFRSRRKAVWLFHLATNFLNPVLLFHTILGLIFSVWLNWLEFVLITVFVGKNTLI